MALGAESLPGWRGKPKPDSRDTEPQDVEDQIPAPHSPDGAQTDAGAEGTPESASAPTTASTTASTTGGGGSQQEPVVVWQADNRLEAQIVKGRLESEGIPAYLSGEALGTIYGLTTGNLAATSVLVPGPLAEKALEILHTEVEWDEWAWEDETDAPDEEN